ncbi:hypothetical protein NVP1149O_77 [Vibrio phage 1.149.O._10N.286.55.A12]|nr:hypothetical protein NVP1149O_77 [Vibrio phage 1.149.O._10N.286.55.A12]
MSKRGAMSLISRSEEFKSCIALFSKFKGHQVCSRYIIAKKIFESPQRKFDVHWSTDAITDGLGDFCGVRLNSRFFRLSRVKRQISSARKYKSC